LAIYACQIPDNIKDVLKSLPRISKTGMASLHTYCRRGLFHACWEILLDQEFLYAYQHGIVLKCADGIMRRVYPRIFTYSADYPEKYLFFIAFVKSVGWLIYVQGSNCDYQGYGLMSMPSLSHAEGLV
jgi:hypothetical protein